MNERISKLVGLLQDTAPLFFPESGFGEQNLADVIMSYETPSERALDFIASLPGSGSSDVQLDVDVPHDVFYSMHKQKITKTDDDVYAKFMDRKEKETVLAQSIGFRAEGQKKMYLEKRKVCADVSGDILGTCQMELFDADTARQMALLPVLVKPIVAKRPKVARNITEFISEHSTCLNTATVLESIGTPDEMESTVSRVEGVLKGLLVEDAKKQLHVFQSLVSSNYFSTADLVHLCNYAFDLLQPNPELLLHVYFALLDKMDKIETPVTFSSALSLVESCLFNNINFHFVFKVFRKMHPPRVLNLLELVLKKIYEIDISIKLMAFDILLKEKSSAVLFEELVSTYVHLDTRKTTDGMEFRHFVIARCFSACIIQRQDNKRNSTGGDVDPNKENEIAHHFIEENYIRCTNVAFVSFDDAHMRETVTSCLTKLKTCGLARTLVVAFIVFNINKLRATKKHPHMFLVLVFGRFLNLSCDRDERMCETVEEEVFYRGVLKLHSTRESLIYVARAVFMFLLKTLKRSKSFMKSAPSTVLAARTGRKGSVTGNEKKSDELADKGGEKMSHCIGKIIKTLAKVDVKYINLTSKERIAVVEILKSHFPFQSPFVKELIISFLDRMKYPNIFGLLLELSKNANTNIKKKAFERLLRFASDEAKAPDVIKVYFSLLKEKQYQKIRFDARILAEMFYFEEEKEIARYFDLGDTRVDTLEKAVLVKHYSKYKPEEVNLEAVTDVLDDVEMVKVKRNAEYVNTVLKIVLNILGGGKSSIERSYVSRTLRKKLELFCNTFVFYDVYVVHCAKILRLLGYSCLQGSSEYYTLINTCLGNKADVKSDSIYGKKALLAHLEYFPDESAKYKRQLVEIFGCEEVLPDLLKLLLKHLRTLDVKAKTEASKQSLQRGSTTSEFYFNFISTNQQCIFAAIGIRLLRTQVLVYRLLIEATIYGAILPQLSAPCILRLIYRCKTLSADRVVTFCMKEIIGTLQETLDFVLSERNTALLGEADGERPALEANDGSARLLFVDIFSSIAPEKERLAFVEKLSQLLSPQNVVYVARSLLKMDLSSREQKVVSTSLRELAQSVPLSDATDTMNLKNILLVFVLSQYRSSLKAKCRVDTVRIERMLEKEEFDNEEKQFIQKLSDDIQLFK